MRPTSWLRSILTFAFGIMVFAMASTAMAAPGAPPNAPEIATGTAAGAIALLIGGGLMVAERLGLRSR